MAADIVTREGRDAVVRACRGQLDGLINNAGINHFGMLENLSDEQLQQIFSVNTLAPIEITRDLLPQLSANAGYRFPS